MALQTHIGLPSLPEMDRLKTARPAFGSDMMLMLDAETHLAGYRRRNQTTYIVSADYTLRSWLGSNAPPGPITAAKEHRFAFRVSPAGLYLALHIDYTASDTASGDPSIEVIVDEMGGATIDLGIRWDRSAGNLPCEEHRVWATGFAVPVYHDEYDLQTVHTPARKPSSLDLAAMSLPRLLDVSSLYGTGGLVDVKITSEFLRLVSVTIEEYVEETI